MADCNAENWKHVTNQIVYNKIFIFFLFYYVLSFYASKSVSWKNKYIYLLWKDLHYCTIETIISNKIYSVSSLYDHNHNSNECYDRNGRRRARITPREPSSTSWIQHLAVWKSKCHDELTSSGVGIDVPDKKALTRVRARLGLWRGTSCPAPLTTTNVSPAYSSVHPPTCFTTYVILLHALQE